MYIIQLHAHKMFLVVKIVCQLAVTIIMMSNSFFTTSMSGVVKVMSLHNSAEQRKHLSQLVSHSAALIDHML